MRLSSQSPNSGDLHRQCSTKQLISRYEYINSNPSQDKSPYRSTPSSTPARPLTVPKHTLPAKVQKQDKSPIRQSFRNLLSVFKRGNVLGKKRSNDILVPARQHKDEPASRTLAGSDIVPLPSTPTKEPISQALAGPLLYFYCIPQYSVDSPILPLWITCTATLKREKIVVSWPSAHGNHPTHTIHLSHCTDVRSLSLSQLSPEEGALLQKAGDGEDLKVFEILFEGRAREKFAASSVRERAGWVSGIWDAILPSQKSEMASNDLSNNKLVDEVKNDPPSYLSSQSSLTSPVPIPNPVPSRLLNPFDPERSLPLIPMEKRLQSLSIVTTPTNQQGSARSFSPVSPSVYPPTRPVSRASSYVKSPSIANLGQMSVVKQRLAQIERDFSRSSSSSIKSTSCFSRGSPSTHLTTPILNAENMYPGGKAKFKRTKTVLSSPADSILDSYCDVAASSHELKVQTTVPVLANDAWSDAHNFGAQRGLQISGTVSTRPNLATPNLEPFTELLHDHAAKSYDQTANLSDQIVSLQNEVQKLSYDFASVIGTAPEKPTMYAIISNLEDRTNTNGQTLGSIHDKLTAAEEHWKQVDTTTGGNILQVLQSIHQQLARDFPDVLSRLNQLQEMGSRKGPIPVAMHNLMPACPDDNPPISKEDLSMLHAKLDHILTLYQTAARGDGKNPGNGTEDQKHDLRNIVALLENDKAQRDLQASQQADSVRYLNELNSWLEAFVNNGTSHISSLTAGVDQLCKDLGYSTASLGTGDPSGGSSGLLVDIRQLLIEMKAKEQSSAALQASVDGLLACMSPESQNPSSIEYIASMMDRQHRDQEGLLRALTAELSDEIKGERLRFVEAMKEATAINVQIHVEQFKQELTREVLGMTEEVGRLHRERQVMENQIAELFAFYTKQKQVGTISIPTIQVPSQHVVEHQRPPSRQHRPLPQYRRL